MSTIAQKSAELAKTKFSDVFEALQGSFIDDRITNEMAEYLEHDTEIEKLIKEEQKYAEKLKEEFEKYCQQLICIGFNSARYDINLIKSYLVKHLIPEKGNETFTVKRNNSYACISTPQFKFLDITQYLSQDINYSGFLCAFDVQECKGFFPINF